MCNGIHGYHSLAVNIYPLRIPSSFLSGGVHHKRRIWTHQCCAWQLPGNEHCFHELYIEMNHQLTKFTKCPVFHNLRCKLFNECNIINPHFYTPNNIQKCLYILSYPNKQITVFISCTCSINQSPSFTQHILV